MSTATQASYMGSEESRASRTSSWVTVAGCESASNRGRSRPESECVATRTVGTDTPDILPPGKHHGACEVRAGRRRSSEVAARDLVTWVQAALAVSDDERALLLWLPEGSGFGYRVDDRGEALREEPIEVVAGSRLAVGTWKDSSVLIWNPTGATHSVWWFFRAARFTGWYVNLEIRGQRWTDDRRRGIDLADLGLDVVVDPDLAWRWKDEEDFRAFTGAPGYWTPGQAEAARAEGLRVVALIEEGSFPFDGTYCDFNPDPTWGVPALPLGWDSPPAVGTASLP